MLKMPTNARAFLTAVGTLTVLIMVGIFVKSFFTADVPATLSCQQFGSKATAFVHRLHGGEVLIKLVEKADDLPLWTKDTPAEFTCKSIFGDGWFNATK